MAETLNVVARMIAAETALEELIPAMTRLVEETRREAGCIAYDLFQGTDDPKVLVFVEAWESRALWQEHMRGAALARFNRAIGSGTFVAGEVHPLQKIA